MFIRFVIGFVLSTYSFYQFSTFPSIEWMIASLILLAWAWFYRQTLLKFSYIHFFIGVIIGFQWAFLQTFLSPVFPSQALNTPVEIIGEVVGLVQAGQTSSFLQQNKGRPKQKFDLLVSKVYIDNQEIKWLINRPKIRLNWYGYAEITRPGKNQQFLVKLKYNRASFNLGGFDYETYLFKENIKATGYILKKIESSEPLHREFNLRFWLSEHLAPVFADSEFKGIFKALIYGDKADISTQDWEMLKNTGTIHLMAISGLHVGLIAGIGFLLFGWVWWLLAGYSRWVFNAPKVYFAAIGALTFATIYMVLAGASIPTQRAWLMVVAVLVFVAIKRSFQPSSALALAAILVVLWDPRSVLSPGFWLSFTAVALIFASLSYLQEKSFNKWQQLLVIQLLLTIGLTPFVAFYYYQFPVYSIIANLVAVPFVTLIGLPLLFLTVMISFVSESLTIHIMWFNDFLWSGMWKWLHWISDLEFNVFPLNIEVWQLVLFYAGIFILLARVNYQKMILGLTLMIIALGFSFWSEPQTNVRMTVLDVGQAQAVVFETKNHTLLYDTGAYWSKKLDGGKMAVLPYLNARGRQQIDLMIVSHSDSDHAGGMHSILDKIKVKEAVSGQAKILNKLTEKIVFKPCVAGQTWQFDELKVEVIAPLPGWETPKKDNDTSCVVKFSVENSSILIMGDLSKRYEKKLQQFYNTELNADILIAGHHGSKTSTTLKFLQQVNPAEVIFTTGYLHRFNHPHPKVIKHVELTGAKWWNTACEGDVSYEFNGDYWAKQESYRKQHLRWYHHRCSKIQKGRFYQ